MRELTAEEEEYLVKYCMEPGNTCLALAIGQINPMIERRILSSFLKKLDKSVKKEIEKRDDLRWQTCIPKKDLEEEDLKEKYTILYVMTMEDQGIEIHLGLFNWNSGPKERELYVGTHKERENKTVPWPPTLTDFLSRSDIEPSNESRYWWSCSREGDRYIKKIGDLSMLNDEDKSTKIAYFTTELVRFAEAISKELRREGD